MYYYIYGITDKGNYREQNEDCILIDHEVINSGSYESTVAAPFIAAVCDGVGGENAGEVASELCLRHLSILEYNSGVDNPVSLYAATKKSNELMAHAYSKLYNIPSTGLRFFTVYGPAGRPDMAYFGFTNKLVKGETIKIFNYGNCKRDFTYVDDIVEGVKRVMMSPPEKKNGEDGLPVPPYKIYNIGNNNPENLLDFVQI